MLPIVFQPLKIRITQPYHLKFIFGQEFFFHYIWESCQDYCIMIYRVFHPVAVLADIVDYYWYSKIDLEQSVQQHYATPILEGMAFNLKNQTEHHTYNNKTLTLKRSAYIFGQPVSPRLITTDEKKVDIIGVKFKSLGIPKITGINMEYFADSIIALDDIWGNEAELLCDEMRSAPSIENTITVLEKFLIKKYLATDVHYRIGNVHNALSLIHHSKGAIRIKTLQGETGTSRKTLERAFINYVGIHPKLYTRIFRFNALKEMIDKADLKGKTFSLALDFGYYDSSHLISEFKHFSGCTLKEYLQTIPHQLIYKDV